MKIHEAASHFFNSQAWRDMKESLFEVWQEVQVRVKLMSIAARQYVLMHDRINVIACSEMASAEQGA